MEAALRVTNCTVMTPGGAVQGGVAVGDDGRIVAVAAGDALPPARETLDGRGRHLLPGLVDGHVHFRDPGLTHKEDFESGTRAAARGGVTTVIDMPNTIPPVTTAEVLTDKAARLAGRALVDYGLISVITGPNLDEMDALSRAGTVAYKIFLGPTTGDLPSPDDGQIVEALARAARTGLPLGVHAENPGLVAAATARLKAAGRVDPLAHAEARPPLAEAESVQRMICFARATRARLHVFHLTTGVAVDLVRQAKSEGLRVTAETCPHYLTLTAGDMARLGAAAKMNPPLRSPADVEALWAGVRDGTVDVVATDHAPHALEEKTRPVIWDNASGASSVQFLLPLLLEHVARGRLALTDLVRLAAEAPARLYGLFPRKGAIAVGGDADLVLVDLGRTAPIRAADMESKVQLTPFAGIECRGWPVVTLSRGRVVMRDDQVVGRPGHGRFVRPA
ncbi:MAG: allantoinase AllB [Candidatus Rokuibacteriota bacterium]